MKYAYYPGCASESTARDQDMSIRLVAQTLGLELVEPQGWTCCGSTPAHQTDHFLATALALANLLMVEKSNLDMMVSCASCYNRLKKSCYDMKQDSELHQRVTATLNEEYQGTVAIRHFIEILHEDIGLDQIQKAFTHSLNGLKVVSYYGCLLVRPPEVNHFDDPENPMSLDKLVTAMGGESLDWPHKVECCGGGFTLTRPDMVIELSAKILTMARASGAQCVVVACPMCQINLDLRQNDINRKKNANFRIPVVYISQLLGLCLGLSPKKLGLDKCMISPKKIINSIARLVQV